MLLESEEVVVDVYVVLGWLNDDLYWVDLWYGGVAFATKIFEMFEFV